MAVVVGTGVAGFFLAPFIPPAPLLLRVQRLAGGEEWISASGTSYVPLLRFFLPQISLFSRFRWRLTQGLQLLLGPFAALYLRQLP